MAFMRQAQAIIEGGYREYLNSVVGVVVFVGLFV